MKEDINFVCYGNEFKQIILNLVNNAKEALISNNIVKPAILLRAIRYKQKLVIDIVDNAGGIPNDIINKVFDPYFTTKGDQGTGIGLHIIKSIIEEHMSGTITVKQGSKGAHFTVTLPLPYSVQ
jgi:signal transduction histidine kinase